MWNKRDAIGCLLVADLLCSWKNLWEQSQNYQVHVLKRKTRHYFSQESMIKNHAIWLLQTLEREILFLISAQKPELQ